MTARLVLQGVIVRLLHPYHFVALVIECNNPLHSHLKAFFFIYALDYREYTALIQNTEDS